MSGTQPTVRAKYSRAKCFPQLPSAMTSTVDHPIGSPFLILDHVDISIVYTCRQVVVAAIDTLLSGLERATIERVSQPMGAVFDFIIGGVKSIALKTQLVETSHSLDQEEDL